MKVSNRDHNCLLVTSGGRGAKRWAPSMGIRKCLTPKKCYISFCELYILGQSAVLYLLFVKSFIVAYDRSIMDNAKSPIILWTSHSLFFKSWLKSNYSWAPGWATAQVTPVLNTPLPLTIVYRGAYHRAGVRIRICAASRENSAAAARYRRDRRAASHRVGVARLFQSTGQLRIETNGRSTLFQISSRVREIASAIIAVFIFIDFQ